MEILIAFLERLSQYNVLNNLIPGTILCILLKYYVGYNLMVGELYELIFICYFVGLINSRFGSIVIEPILKKLRIIRFAPFSDYVAAESINPKIQILSAENNMFRSFVSVIVLTLLSLGYIHLVEICEFVKRNESWIIIVVLFFLFSYSYRKQTNYIRKRVEAILKKGLNTPE